MLDNPIPVRLRNGAVRPKTFGEILAAMPTPPRYKIILFAVNRLFGRYRLVHSFYIYLLGDDPSRLKTFMQSKKQEPISGFEDGKFIQDLMQYRIYLTLEQMVPVGGMIAQIIDENSTAYAMVRFHNIVQYSSNYNETIVFPSITGVT
jgi:hypothetical protein